MGGGVVSIALQNLTMDSGLNGLLLCCKDVRLLVCFGLEELG